MLKITLTKSTISETPRNRATVHALGLRKTNRSVIQEDTPVIRGMIHHVKHLLKVEAAEGATKVRKRQGKKAAVAPVKAVKPAPAKPVEEAPKADTPKAAEAKAAKPVTAEKPKKPTAAKSAPKKAPAKKKES